MSNAPRVVLVTIDGFFGQSIPTERSLDIRWLASQLEEYGHEIGVTELEELTNGAMCRNDVYVFGSHQNPEVKRYLDDVVSTVFALDRGRCIPRPELLLAHENKGIQSILVRLLGLDMPSQQYVLGERPPVDASLVVKHVAGAGSGKVFLAKPGERYARRLLWTGISSLTISDVAFIVKWPIKHLIGWKHFTSAYRRYNRRYFRHVLQRFIPSPGYDYKVLVFFDKCYVLKRMQRDRDFRASGSGKFYFVSPSKELIRYSKSLREALDTPYVSLDIIDNDGRHECIEFQCTHFGPYTQIYAKHYYELVEDNLIENVNDLDLETAYAYSIDRYLRDKREQRESPDGPEGSAVGRHG